MREKERERGRGRERERERPKGSEGTKSTLDTLSMTKCLNLRCVDRRASDRSKIPVAYFHFAYRNPTFKFKYEKL